MPSCVEKKTKNKTQKQKNANTRRSTFAPLNVEPDRDQNGLPGPPVRSPVNWWEGSLLSCTEKDASLPPVSMERDPVPLKGKRPCRMPRTGSRLIGTLFRKRPFSSWDLLCPLGSCSLGTRILANEHWRCVCMICFLGPFGGRRLRGEFCPPTC